MRAKDYVKSNVAYHTQLNPAVWDGTEMEDEVRYALLKIAKIFIGYLEIENFRVIDVVLTGSLANYNYTKFSDFDLHVVTDYADLQCDDIAEAFYRAKKQIWNDAHDITVHGHEVELYVEDINEPPVSAGVFSVLKNEWIETPNYSEPVIDKPAINAKVKVLIQEIEKAIATADDPEDIHRVTAKIRKMRRAGLDANGEFAVENLAFKVLRNLGYIDKLSTAYHQQQDKDLSV